MFVEKTMFYGGQACMLALDVTTAVICAPIIGKGYVTLIASTIAVDLLASAIEHFALKVDSFQIFFGEGLLARYMSAAYSGLGRVSWGLSQTSPGMRALKLAGTLVGLAHILGFYLLMLSKLRSGNRRDESPLSTPAPVPTAAVAKN